jgi:hypothetical protein
MKMMKLAQKITKSDASKETKNIKDQSGTKPKRNKRFRGCKIFFTLGMIAFICLIICSGVLAFGWVTGYTRQAVCDAVLEDSMIYDAVDCDEIESDEAQIDEPDSEYPVKVNDERSTTGDINVAAVFEGEVNHRRYQCSSSF